MVIKPAEVQVNAPGMTVVEQSTQDSTQTQVCNNMCHVFCFICLCSGICIIKMTTQKVFRTRCMHSGFVFSVLIMIFLLFLRYFLFYVFDSFFSCFCV